MKTYTISLISALAQVPTSYPATAYGGIERIVADLSIALQNKGHKVEVYATPGSSIKGVPVHIVENELSPRNMKIDSDFVLDFSHFKEYDGDKYSIPFLTDAVGENPIYPTDFVKCYSVRNGAENGSVVYPGIDISRNLKTKHNPEDYYVFMSRIMPIKGVQEVIWVAEQLDIPLKIMGATKGSPFSDYIKAIKEKAKQNPNIEFIGEVTEDEKLDYLSHAKGLIAHPQWHLTKEGLGESFGIFAVEALASGIPVFLPTIPNGCNEIINRKTGCFYDINTPSTLKNIVNFKATNGDCRARALYFTSHKYASSLLDLLQGQYKNL